MRFAVIEVHDIKFAKEVTQQAITNLGDHAKIASIAIDRGLQCCVTKFACAYMKYPDHEDAPCLWLMGELEKDIIKQMVGRAADLLNRKYDKDEIGKIILRMVLACNYFFVFVC